MSRPRPKLSRPIVALAVAVLLAGAAFGVVRARGPRVAVVEARVRDLEQHIVASGRVWVPERATIAPRTPGLVVAVGAVAGQRVKAGELLVQLDEAEARNAVRQAETGVAQAGARLAQLRRVGAIVATEALRQAQTQLADSEAHLAATEKLAAADAVPADSLADAKRAVEVAQAQRNAALAQQVAATPAGADSRVVLTAQLHAEAQLAGATLRLEQQRLVAPVAGVVLSRAVERGDFVTPGQGLFVLAGDADTQLVFQPDERNLSLLALGQRAKVSADAWPQTLFDAELSYIAPGVDPQRGSVEVRLRVPNAPPFLKPDMTVSIDLTVAAREAVLTLPTEALRDARTAKPWVFAVVDDRLVRRDVTPGIRGDGSTEIRAGLAAGELVFLPRGEALAEGRRVRGERVEAPEPD